MKAMWATYKALTLRLLVIGVLAPITLSARPLARSVAGEGRGEGARIPATPDERARLAKGAAVAAYGKLPLSFEANQGQSDRRVKFLSRGAGYGLFLTSTEAVLALNAGSARRAKKASVLPVSLTQKPPLQKSAVLRMRLERANSNARVSGIDELPGKSNYFIGRDPAKWRSNIPTYSRVKYQQVYSGVDLVYYGDQRQLEYDFVLAPGADPQQIEVSFDGAKQLRLDADGDLIVSLAGGEVIEHKPVIYQDIGGRRRQVAGGYALKDAHTVGFKLGGYDAHRSLTIDPTLAYSTYLGGSNIDYGHGIAVDASGNAYVTGQTSSSDFPTTPGAFQTTLGGPRAFNAFISKLNPSGSALLYSTYLGGSSGDNGSSGDSGNGIAVDSSGNAYVVGSTGSNDFPTTPGAFQTTFGRDEFDGFVSKLNPSGSALLYSTYLGGSGDDDGYGIALDSSGNAYVTGYTESTDFPTTPGAFQIKFIGGGDAFVSKLNSSGSALVYSTYLGRSDRGFGITLDSSGSAYVTGFVASRYFPTTAGAFQTTYHGLTDAFVSKLNSAGSALVYSTYLGGSSDDEGYGITLDSSGNAYVTGLTGSSDFPTTADAFQTTLRGTGDAFVSKLNNRGSALVYSTYLGGSGDDEGYGIAVDSAGNAYVTGDTSSSDFPTTPGAFRTTGGVAFVSKLNSRGSALVYSTYLGGRDRDYSNGIALDSTGNAYVTGITVHGDFPTTPGAFQSTYGGGYSDAFVIKFSFGPGIAFSHFSGGVRIDPDAGVFYLSGHFSLGPGGSINPPTEPVTFGVDSSLVTLPAGSFVKYKIGYVYQKTVNHIFLCVLIGFTKTPGTYFLMANRFGGTLSTTSSPVPVALTIGDDFGVTPMPAKFY